MAAGAPHEVLQYHHDPRNDAFGDEGVAAALGVSKATMAERAAAERSSGYVIGGISPLGQRRPLPTVVDEFAR